MGVSGGVPGGVSGEVAALVTLLDWAALALAALSVLGWAVTFGSTLATVYLVALHHRLRARGLEAEREALAQPLPPDEALPHVVVQIPTYNEGALVARALDAALALDWPAARLHVQLLDDSTDGSRLTARREVEVRRLLGHDVTLVQRDNRREFKAGALAGGMRLSPHAYFAIFDADYVPAPDFLRRVMAPLLADPGLAFAQARFGYFNAGANRLTRLQAVLLDAHLAVEQATRSWAGHPLPFNGTCGVWRRDAIEAAGGWQGGTLAEDLDLSYRAWLIGRRGRFLSTIEVPGELPEEWEAWIGQQKRWTKGFGEATLRHLGPVLLAPGLRFGQRAAALMHLGVWWAGPAWGLALPCGIAAMILHPGLIAWLAPPLIGQVAVGYLALFAFLRAGNLSLRPGEIGRREFAGLFIGASRLLLAMGAAIGPAQREVVFRRHTEFIRTVKTARATAPVRPARPAERGTDPGSRDPGLAARPEVL